ncbi:MAG: cation transport ATPase, P-type [Candidatus Phytoplasma cynodontis]|uniref:heavy metal translocating P-type ATPase n=1 Tax='Cynodon dactylon' phytoplasma TaxID=295320 RepID=UPI001FCE6FB0|nr:heavy metal translocating P-type ATPase ['Cynodon dactylon' phytoplasma]WIA07514.1 MAG: cation transport ATPase, P-type [Candidatus Phytoplasma cynodontis]
MYQYLKKNERKHFLLFFCGILVYCLCFVPFNFIKINKIFFKKYDSNFLIQLISTIIIMALSGYHIIIEGFILTYKNTKNKKKFTPNVHILMILGALGAIYLKEFNEANLLIIIFSGANFLEEHIESKSDKEIKKLFKITSNKTRLLNKDGEFSFVDIQELKINDKVLVLNGDQIPSDGIIISGSSFIDESNITGESMPIEKKIGDKVFGSNINLTNSLIIKITKTAEESVFNKIIQISKKIKKNISKKAVFIKNIEPLYVKTVIFIVLIVLFVGCILDNSYINLYFNSSILDYLKFRNIFKKMMVFLTVASPCALAVADIPATLSAISNLAKKGILIKSGKSLDVFSNVRAIVFDKTGTLTKGKPFVKEIFFDSCFTWEKEKKIEYLNILFGMEKNSNHPISFAIQRYLKNVIKPKNDYLKINITNFIGIGIEYCENDNIYKVCKYNYFYDSDDYFISDFIKDETKKFLSKGETVIYFSHNNKVIMGIALSDEIRSNAKETIHYFKKNKIKTIMLTGDNKKVAEYINSFLDLDLCFSNCLPEDKLQYINNIKQKYNNIAMVGDGVNDSLALANSDVSITLQEGSDIAIELSDIILMRNDLIKIEYTHNLSVKLNKIIKQNIIFSILVILILSIANFIITIPFKWAGILHELSTILVILNGLRVLKNKKI